MLCGPPWRPCSRPRPAAAVVTRTIAALVHPAAKAAVIAINVATEAAEPRAANRAAAEVATADMVRAVAAALAIKVVAIIAAARDVHFTGFSTCFIGVGGIITGSFHFRNPSADELSVIHA